MALRNSADIVGDYRRETEQAGLESVAWYDKSALSSLLQTPGYARACLGRTARQYKWSSDQLDKAVDLRMKRTDRLIGDATIEKIVVIEESSLDNQLGSTAVMAAITEHVGMMFRQPPESTTLRLIPQRAIPGTEDLRGGLSDYIITRSREHGVIVWANDGIDSTPEASAAFDGVIDVHQTQIHQLAVPNDQAVAIIAQATERWQREP